MISSRDENESSPYKKLLPEIQQQIEEDRANKKENPYRCNDDSIIRRNPERDKANLWRPAFVRDTEKILHLPVYNRYADKTQVFSLFKNDDITRRALHVQLVSRIARSIGNVLGLNTDLIEAVALGHDIGHTPFGHAGERFLSDLLHGETGIFFNHNVHSVRVLDVLFRRNVSLQVLDGILCHNGEFEMQEYKPKSLSLSCSAESPFDVFDREVYACDTQGDEAIKKLVPVTLESCVVRICDMIAYLGKDRQDAVTAHLISENEDFTSQKIGKMNAEIINNLTVDIINNSYGKNYILLSPEYYQDLKTAKKENYQKIYKSPVLADEMDGLIRPMFSQLYYRLLDDVIKQDESSVIWKHHINFIKANTRWYDEDTEPYCRSNPHRIVSDFIASMTDDYFIDLYELLFPESSLKIEYKSYFDEV